MREGVWLQALCLWAKAVSATATTAVVESAAVTPPADFTATAAAAIAKPADAEAAAQQ